MARKAVSRGQAQGAMSRCAPPPAGGLDFTARMRAVCEHAVGSLDQLQHIDLSRVAFSFAQARKPVPHGLQASLTPLRFEGGAVDGIHRGRRYTVQPVFDQAGNQMLYVLNFYLPRFMQLSFREKLVTVFHELWHISPEFNGDLRRHPGRCYAHSHSQADYDRQMGVMVDAWLNVGPPTPLIAFLELDFDQMLGRYGRVVGLKVPRPKLIPCR